MTKIVLINMKWSMLRYVCTIVWIDVFWIVFCLYLCSDWISVLGYSQKAIKESQQSQRTDFVSRFGGTFKVYYNLVFIRTNVQEILISNTTFFSYSYWPHSLKIVIFALRKFLPTKKKWSNHNIQKTCTYNRKHAFF